MFPYRPLGSGGTGWSRVPDVTTRTRHDQSYSHAAAIVAAEPSGVVRGPALRLAADRDVIDLRRTAEVRPA